jgi:16S rRNA (guanine527-N7)-methyltransferase
VTDLQQELTALLVEGASSMGVELTPSQSERLVRYAQEFDKWNKAYNLSAIRDIRQIVARHLLDSLSVVLWIKNSSYFLDRIIDVGTGGGLPGIPLAIMFPEKKFTLLDSNGKKTRFLFHVKTQLKLDNVTVENRRVEEFNPESLFDGVISRAFASLSDMTQGCKNLLSQDGIFMAMKGIYPEQELLDVSNTCVLRESIKLDVAETDGERHLLVLQKA